MGVLLFILAWVLVGFSIFFVALRGGPRGVRSTLQTQSRGGRGVVLGLITVVYVAFGIAIPALVLADDNNARDNHLAGVKLNKAQAHGRELFGRTCQQCHTLAASNAVGRVGPNLDTLAPARGARARRDRQRSRARRRAHARRSLQRPGREGRRGLRREGRGAQLMDDAKARELLEAERSRIEKQLADLDRNNEDNELANVDQHLADAGTELYEQERDAGLIEQLRDQLAAVERAEKRLEEGKYGLSIDSGEPIPDARLEAVPHAERTVEEQERYERGV